MTHEQWLRRKLASFPNERLRREFIVAQTREKMYDFTASWRRIQDRGLKIKWLMDEWPSDRPFPITSEFVEALRAVKKIAEAFLKKM